MHSLASSMCLLAVVAVFYPGLTNAVLSPQGAAILQASLTKTNAFIAADIVEQIALKAAKDLVDPAFYVARAADFAVHDGATALDAMAKDTAVLPLITVQAASVHVAALAKVTAYRAAIAAFVIEVNAALTLSNTG